MKRWGRWYSASMWNNGHYQSNRIQKIVMPEHEVPVIDDLTCYIPGTFFQWTDDSGYIHGAAGHAGPISFILKNTDWKKYIVPMDDTTPDNKYKVGTDGFFTAYDKYVDIIYTRDNAIDTVNPETTGHEADPVLIPFIHPTGEQGGFSQENYRGYTEYYTFFKTEEFPHNGKYFLGFRLYPFYWVYGNSQLPNGESPIASQQYPVGYNRTYPANPVQINSLIDWYPDFLGVKPWYYNAETTEPTGGDARYSVVPLAEPWNPHYTRFNNHVNIAEQLLAHMPNFPDPSAFWAKNPHMHTHELLNVRSWKENTDYYGDHYYYYYSSEILDREPYEEYPQIYSCGNYIPYNYTGVATGKKQDTEGSTAEKDNQEGGVLQLNTWMHRCGEWGPFGNYFYADGTNLGYEITNTYERYFNFPDFYSPRLNLCNQDATNDMGLCFWVLPAIYDAAGNMIV